VKQCRVIGDWSSRGKIIRRRGRPGLKFQMSRLTLLVSALWRGCRGKLQIVFKGRLVRLVSRVKKEQRDEGREDEEKAQNNQRPGEGGTLICGQAFFDLHDESPFQAFQRSEDPATTASMMFYCAWLLITAKRVSEGWYWSGH
jgi:hypothetical protein